MAAVLARGGDLTEAVRTGAAAGAVNVTRHGLGTGQAETIRALAERVRADADWIGAAMTTPMRVLITNDDGVAAPGIRWLARAAVDAGLDVVVAAPDYEASGASAALNAVYEEGRLAIGHATIDGVDVTAFSVKASPSYIVVLVRWARSGPRRTSCCPASTAGPTRGTRSCTPARSAPP